jgi:hypothetical protein
LEDHKCGRGWIRQCQDDECSDQDPNQSAKPTATGMVTNQNLTSA